MKTQWFILPLIGLAVAPLHAQSFINLDFESAINIPVGDPLYVETIWLDWSDAAPGWSHSSGDDTQIVYHEHTHVGFSQWYWLIDSELHQYYNFHSPLSGRFSLSFKSGYADSLDWTQNWTQAYIAQTGLIPPDTQSIRLKAQGPFQVFLGGDEIHLTYLGGSNYGADIPSYAGQVLEMKILNPSTEDLALATTIDDIQFSSIPIPEVSGNLLWSFFLLIVAAYYRRTSKTS